MTNIAEYFDLFGNDLPAEVVQKMQVIIDEFEGQVKGRKLEPLSREYQWRNREMLLKMGIEMGRYLEWSGQ